MLSNTAVPKYFAAFREKVESGEIPVCYKILQQMDRIEKKIASPIYYYDPAPVEGFIKFCENVAFVIDKTMFSPLAKVFWKGEFEGKNLFFKKGRRGAAPSPRCRARRIITAPVGRL